MSPTRHVAYGYVPGIPAGGTGNETSTTNGSFLPASEDAVHPPQVVTTAHSLKETIDYFSSQDEFVIDVETVGTHRGIPAVNTVTWVALATRGAAVVIPMGHPNGNECLRKATWRKNPDTGLRETLPAIFSPPPPQLRPSQVFEALEPLLFSERTKIAHNAPFDFLSIAKYYDGNYPPPPYGDTIVAAWLANENRLLNLKTLLEKDFGLVYDDKNVGKRVEAHTFKDVATYGYMDAKGTWLEWRKWRPQVTAEGLEKVWELEMDVLEVLLHMQRGGCPMDVAALQALRTDLRRDLVKHEGDVYRAAGRVFNLASVPQKQHVLYGPAAEGCQGLEPAKHTKKGAASTDAEALSKHKGNPVVSSLLEYQNVSKLLGTYVDGYLGTEDKPTKIFNGIIYPSFKQYGTVTGRFSCSDPNVQNWPRADSEYGQRIRDLVVPPPGFRLLIADYGQIEQRILAHFAGNGALWQGFWDGIDAHTTTASTVFGISPEEVTKQMRQVAKAIAFAICYGAGPDKVAEMAGISLRQAKQILKTHEKTFPEIYRYKDHILTEVAKRRPTPYLKTLLGRKRRLPDLMSRIPSQRAQAERQVVNSHMQGSNADLTKLAMVRMHKKLLPGMQILLTVHDEIAVMSPVEHVEEGAFLLHDAMAGPEMQLLSVPIVTDVKVCDRWSQAK